MTTPFPAGHIATAAEFAARGTIDNNQRNTTVTLAARSTEQLLQSSTFTALAAVEYSVFAKQSVQSAAASADLVQVHLRWAAGASVTSAGALIDSVIVPCPSAGIGNWGILLSSFVPGAGQVTVGAFAVANAAAPTGVISSFGAATNINTLYVRGEW